MKERRTGEEGEKGGIVKEGRLHRGEK